MGVDGSEHALAAVRWAAREASLRHAAVRIVAAWASIVEGQAARVLVEAARGAELLVVGSRGLGGFRSLLLGSVGQQCAHHALCPVVIVRAERPRA